MFDKRKKNENKKKKCYRKRIQNIKFENFSAYLCCKKRRKCDLEGTPEGGWISFTKVVKHITCESNTPSKKKTPTHTEGDTGGIK